MYTLLCLAAGWLVSSLAYPVTDVDSSVPLRAIAYVQTFHTTNGDQLSLLPIRAKNSQLSHIYLAAVHINDTPGDITLNDKNPNDTYWDNMWDQAADLQTQGVTIMMMLGGAAAGSYPRLCGGSSDGGENSNVINDDYYIPLLETIRYHNIQGLDLDIEENVDISCPLSLLRRLYADLGPSFILTMAPVATDLQPSGFGLSGVSYSALDAGATADDKSNGKLIDWFNVQFYNGWGNAASPDGYNAIINNGYDPSRVVLGVLDSPNDGGSGWYNLTTYGNTLKQLKANYPSYNSFVSWEYYDAGLGDEVGYTTDDGGNTTPGSGTYSDDPWVWDSTIADALAGSSDLSRDITVTTIPRGASPWPAATESLLTLTDSDWIGVIWALNQTAGDVERALSLLTSSGNLS
ncbi:glycoside hydrolase family 18 protein [Polychaeton citri CBS 116435]|uniref:Glycoside hydrolase family 18 protein n=1 Tax=Polychaeton citri CBS 116435 TaxID=1314669 RepID=A0A9P4QAF9_9PEZI|nr:glycoside hydrolase family 18 protein [Polychaeton citri CBS 116435]